MVEKEELEELYEVFRKCEVKNMSQIIEVNKRLINLSTAQLEYILELSRLLFCQSLK